MLKDRTRDIDRIIKGKYHDDVERGIVRVGQLLGELSARSHFNSLR
jgi:hypothetical protein